MTPTVCQKPESSIFEDMIQTSGAVYSFVQICQQLTTAHVQE